MLIPSNHSVFMKKVLLLLTLALFSSSWLSSSQLSAAPIPTLKKQAKFLFQQKPQRLPKKSQKQIILGVQNDISPVKQNAHSARATPYAYKSIRKKISSKSAIIIDAETSGILFSILPDKQRQPASTIKILTGMIAIKSLKNTELISVSKKASQMPRSKVYLDTRKKYKANDLINAVLLASANDASVAIAEKIAGSEKEFAEMMTLRAKIWGAKNTICKTATGLTKHGQKSTARDLALIFRHAMLDKEFVKRMNRSKIRTSYGKTLRNHNRALKSVKGAIAGKTGYTDVARQTYVGQFSRAGESIIVAIMGSETMWQDIKQLVDYGFQRKHNLQAAIN